MDHIDASVADIQFFDVVIRSGSLSAAARELQVTPAAVSKRLAALERRLEVSLLSRSTRRIGLTHEGERYLNDGRAILTQLDTLVRALRSGKSAPSGLLRVNATLGFGRVHIAPFISAFARTHPHIQVQLQLSVDPPPLTDNQFDVCIRFGEPPDTRVHAYKLADNARVLCASPAYLAKYGTPRNPTDLLNHATIAIRQGNIGYGVWRLAQGARHETIKVRGPLSTNDGEVAVNWALAGHGILLRAEWDIRRYLQSGRLKAIMTDWKSPEANIYAVVPAQHHDNARVRCFIDDLQAHFANVQR